MWHELIGHGKFFAQLIEVDETIARQVQAGRCPLCGGRLDRSDFPRKPRGDLGEAEASYARRISLCCDACRRRVTPPSTRFLGRKVYVAPYVILAGVVGAVASLLASARTRRRWIAWWQTVFVASAFFRAECAALMPPVTVKSLPGSLLARFVGDSSAALEAMLRWISPVTTSTSPRRTMAM